MRALLVLIWALLALPAAAQEIVITFGGDVNFAQSRVRPDPAQVVKFGRHPIGSTTEFLATELTGHINFVNVETVVSDRDGVQQPKTFVFRSHPEAFRHLMDLGVNAFSLANNHAYDHGWQGMADTLAFFEGADRFDRPLLFGGIGAGTAATAPRIAEIGGVRVAFAAIGIGAAGFAADDGVTGMAMWRDPAHYDAALAGLRDAEADLRILSIHYGTENQVSLDWGQREDFRRAVEEANVNLVLGHHPHVVRAVEAGPDHAIFYSLGNLLFAGGAIRDGLPVGQDYGLLGKAYFHIGPDGPRLTALEAVPLVGVHLAPAPMSAWRAEATLRNLSAISRTAAGEAGVDFTPLAGIAPRGAACYGGPYGPAARELCCRLARTLDCDVPDLM
ncbi:CapA family protein [Wenxinia marina]|uniref:Bacterial capsule synthesis protein n=1 Tax=Wenxinia marina DSM 24838 TaxID=1123501 RepID=A0A0D0PBW8_9RHOB|nr:CapA family protein [Wenxinia marina]KIQ68971.1 Bacterial capsule synthesis protein [Wenxinia marina DSM 24838]GGL63664.1 hypothetical protein GCM10011392_18000 [Wenxinia marina]